MSARLLRRVTVVEDVSDLIAVEYNGGGTVYPQITAGTYYLSGDGEAGDLLAEIETQIEAEAGFPGITLEILGIGQAPGSSAQGRVYVDHAGSGNDLVFHGEDAAWTLGGGAGILGFADGAAATVTGGTPVTTDGPARSTWYPQTMPQRATGERGRWSESVSIRGTDDTDALSWGRYVEFRGQWERGLLAPFLRVSSSGESGWQGVVGLGASPTWASWEAFCEDVQAARDAGLGDDIWRIYPRGLTSTPLGPYRWPDQYPGWDFPMAAATRYGTGGDEHGLTLDGVVAL